MGNKYGYNGANGGANNKGGMGNMLKQAQQMQEQLMNAQQELEELVVEGSASQGLVKVSCNCKKVISGITIDPSIVDGDDVEMLEDLILAAINDAYAQADSREAELMQPFAALKGMF